MRWISFEVRCLISSLLIAPGKLQNERSIDCVYSSRYLSTFNYVYLRAQHEAERLGNTIDKEYAWPISFPNCTTRLRMYIVIRKQNLIAL